MTRRPLASARSLHRVLASMLVTAAIAVPASVATAQSSTGAEPPAAKQTAPPVRTIKEWSLPKRGTKLAVQGYDPVAYFAEGGGKAKKGKKSIEHVHGGVTYRFVNEKNRDLFKANPARYEPAHGGWCSWAMRSGDKTEVDPKNFIVKDDRLFLFYKGFFGDTRKDWRKTDHAASAKKADDSWRKISREEPRQAKPKAKAAA